MKRSVGRPILLEERRSLLLRIAEFIDTHGYNPSFRDLGDSKGGAYHYCQDLQDAGLILFDRGVARSIRLTDEGCELVAKLKEAVANKESPK